MLIDSVHFHVSAQSYLSSNGGTRGHHNICLIRRSKISELLHAVQLYLIHHPYPIGMIFVNEIHRVLCEQKPSMSKVPMSPVPDPMTLIDCGWHLGYITSTIPEIKLKNKFMYS